MQLGFSHFTWSGATRIALGVGLTALMIGASAAPAQARYWRHVHHHHYTRQAYRGRASAPANPAFAAIVVDENSGKTLYRVNEDAARHPASLTKVMTLYLLFEKLDSGEITLQTQIPISEHAASQAPSKLGIAAGESISIEDAIKAVVTRSANDVAVAIGEKLAGDEDSFARAMTRKAHALGMSKTNFVNASGLPDDAQLTSARDLATLAQATEEKFPRYFHYFSTSEFTYNGEVIGNHNRLIGRVEGVDGIKTGYTRASGFNLLTSLHRDGRSLVAVVLGGRTSGERDRTMASLVQREFAYASNVHSATMVAETRVEAKPTRIALVEPPVRPAQPIELVRQTSTPAQPIAIVTASAAKAPVAPPAVAAIEQGDTEEPDHVASQPLKRALLASAHQSVAKPDPTSLRVASSALDKTPAELGWVRGLQGVTRPAATIDVLPPVRPKEETTIARVQATPAIAHNSWVIQVGATDDAGKAAALLTKAQAQTGANLAAAKPFTEKFLKGEDVYYRARFAGLDSNSAETACKSLKRNGFSCFTSHE